MSVADSYRNYLRSRIVVSGGGGGAGYGSGYTGGNGRFSYVGPAIPGLVQVGQPQGQPWDFITPADWLSVPAWYRACILVSTALASYPCHVKAVEETGGFAKKTIDRDHPSHFPLAVQGNREQTPAQVWGQMAWLAVENGSSRAAIYDNKSSGRREIIPFCEGDCWKERIDGDLWYVVDLIGDRSPKTMRKLRPAEVFELTMPQPDGIQAVAPWWVARRANYESLQGARVRANRSKNNGRPHLALATDQVLNEKTVERTRKEMSHVHTGLDESMVPMILDGGLKPVPLNYSADQKNESELWRIPVSEISNATGVPVSMLGDFDAGGYDSLEADVKKFLEFTVRAWLDARNDQANAKLLTLNERIDGSRVIEHYVDGLRGVDEKVKSEIMRSMLGGAPVGTINEMRDRFLGWAPLPDKDANKLQLPKNIGQDGSANNLGSDGKPTGRPTKTASATAANIALVRATTSRCAGRIVGRATAAAKDVTKYLDFAAAIKDRYTAEVQDELATVFAAVSPQTDSVSLAADLVAFAHDELNAVAGRVTVKAELPEAVRKCGVKVVREWQRRATKCIQDTREVADNE